MATQVSRYGIVPYDLRIKALNLTLGQGSSDRFGSPDAMRFILEGEIWAEQQISDFIAVPLKPVKPPVGITLPTWTPTQVPNPIPQFPPNDPVHPDYTPEVAVTAQGMKWNYPLEFIDAAEYWAMARMLRSEYFEVEPNKSESITTCENYAYMHIYEFRVRSTVLVGAGRRRNPNPHMPPNIAPKGNIPPFGGAR